MQIFGTDFPMLGVFFAPNNSLCVTFNKTLVVEIEDAYHGPDFTDNWAFLGLSYATT